MESTSSSSLDYSQQYPSIVRITPSSAIPLHQCPVNMHMILWAASHPVAISLHPSLPPNQTSATSFFEMAETSPEAASASIDFILQPDEVLFVPRTHLVSLTSSSQDGPVSFLLRHCIVDASNYRQFMSSLSEDVRLSARNAPLLETLLSKATSEDLFMNRAPRSISLAQLLAGPRTESDTSPSSCRTFRGKCVLCIPFFLRTLIVACA